MQGYIITWYSHYIQGWIIIIIIIITKIILKFSMHTSEMQSYIITWHSYYIQGCHRGPGAGNFPRLLWAWSPAVFVGSNRKMRPQELPGCWVRHLTNCIYPATWNLSDSLLHLYQLIIIIIIIIITVFSQFNTWPWINAGSWRRSCRYTPQTFICGMIS